jgi:pimeloyl-ACP methyl ester carboxylesterase
VHGALGDYRQWAPIGDRLATDYRVVALSRRYHWPNPAPESDAPYTYERQCDDLLAWLRAGGRSVHLAGHSYGAGIVLLAALREPRIVRSLILIEPPFGSLVPDDAPGLEEELADRVSAIGRIRALAREGAIEEASRLLIDWTQGGVDGMPGLPERLHGVPWAGFAALPAPTQRALLENAATIGPTFAAAPPAVGPASLRALRVPTLVLNGARTRAFYRVIGETAASSIPGARSGRIPGAGHMTIVEQPDETAALMRTFLDEEV